MEHVMVVDKYKTVVCVSFAKINLNLEDEENGSSAASLKCVILLQTKQFHLVNHWKRHST